MEYSVLWLKWHTQFFLFARLKDDFFSAAEAQRWITIVYESNVHNIGIKCLIKLLFRFSHSFLLLLLFDDIFDGKDNDHKMMWRNSLEWDDDKNRSK